MNRSTQPKERCIRWSEEGGADRGSRHARTRAERAEAYWPNGERLEDCRSISHPSRTAVRLGVREGVVIGAPISPRALKHVAGGLSVGARRTRPSHSAHRNWSWAAPNSPGAR